MSKKLGIITVHKNVNYGANLQAFALNEFLKRNGYDCNVIDYTLPSQEQSAHLFSWLKQSWQAEKNKSFSRKIKLGLALALSAPWKSKRLKRFAKFRKQNICLSKQCYGQKDIANLKLDTIICGSDQI